MWDNSVRLNSEEPLLFRIKKNQNRGTKKDRQKGENKNTNIKRKQDVQNYRSVKLIEGPRIA